ncbi:MAG: dsDNA nuclease domain-containing protein, partial [Verrucomicrobia bacterium]|nr:dsDNA nuclease domain-containing protein [Verrucomicrobiota bacterium]
MQATPANAAPREDTGAETGYRFGYQDAWAATLACALMDEPAEFTELFCEHHEDILLKQKNGLYQGIQIKTRQLAGDPWRTGDEDVIKSLARKFVFATNHFFFETSKTANNLPYVLAESRKATEWASIPPFLQRLAEQLAQRTDRGPEEVLDTLKKTECTAALPKLDDSRKTLRETIVRVYPPARDAVHAAIEAAAGHLVAAVWGASSLEHRDSLPAYLCFMMDAKGEAARRRIEGKRFTPERVRNVLQQSLSRPSPPVPPSPELSRTVQAYRSRLEAATAKLELVGLGHGVQLVLPIQQAYIPLRVVVTQALQPQRSGHFEHNRLREAEHVEEDVTLSEVFQRARSFGLRGVLLLGDPGAGKTTGAKQFCWRLLQESPEVLGLPPKAFPVFLRLRNLTKELLAKDLRAFICDAVSAPAQDQELAHPGEALLKCQGIVWVLDGLDEVVHEGARVQVCRWIRQALADRPDDCFLVTSRYQGYQGDVDLGPDFLHVHLQPLNEGQVTDFVNHWYEAVYRRLHPGSATALESGVARGGALLELLRQPQYRIGRMRELPANPLMLTILCLVFHEKKD